ncbi:MAG: hypothetical protein OXH28_02200 [bacterium]|nr:hypothetical protein [bacterium]
MTTDYWVVSPPVPKAPPGYEEPPGRHDTVDVLIVIDRSEGFAPLDDPSPVSHPIDQFVGDLRHHLEVLGNIATLPVTTDEIRYEEDLPTAIYAVVTNVASYAEWCRSWGGNAVEIGLDGETLTIAYRDEAKEFALSDLKDAVSLAMREVTYSPDPLDQDSNAFLFEPISAEEIAGIEPIFAELWRAIDNDELTEAQRAQIQAMAKLLEAQWREMVPGQSARWKLIGPMRSIFRYLIKEVPRDALAWWKLSELLTKINWSTLADTLPA